MSSPHLARLVPPPTSRRQHPSIAGHLHCLDARVDPFPHAPSRVLPIAGPRPPPRRTPSASSRSGSRGSAPTPPPHIAMPIVDPCFVYAAGSRPGGHHVDIRIIATVCLDPLRRTTPLPRRRSSRLR